MALSQFTTPRPTLLSPLLPLKSPALETNLFAGNQSVTTWTTTLLLSKYSLSHGLEKKVNNMNKP
jgi:hypothetical protein